MLDLQSFTEQKVDFPTLVADATKDDLYAATNGLIEQALAILAEADDMDVVFVPHDPNANDTFGVAEERELAWTIGHVVVHLTASIEEQAAMALSMARGLTPQERLRYETHWTAITSAEQVRRRLQESRRMALAMLDAWPEQPHLDVTMTVIPRFGPLNAVSRYVIGLTHGNGHLEQLRDALRQSKNRAPGTII